MDTLYVQFYEKALQIGDEEFYEMNNGFSSVFEECKKTGEFYWSLGKAQEEFPIKKGKAYVSTTFASQVLKTFVWAQDNPEVKFIVGGPAIRYSVKIDPLKSYTPIPENVKLRYGLAENDIFDYDGVKNTWGIEIPRQLQYKSVFVNYTLDRFCYWNQCIFCDWKVYKDDGMRASFEFKLPERNRFQFYLVTGSIRPENLIQIPKLFQQGVRSFRCYARADAQTLKWLPTVLSQIPRGSHYWNIGVEFPSERMLEIIKKGVTVDNIKRTMEIISRYAGTIFLSFIVGWNLLRKEDLLPLAEFMRYIKEQGNPFIYVATFQLSHGYQGPLDSLQDVLKSKYVHYDIAKAREFTAFSTVPILNDEERKVNQEALDIIKNSGVPFKGSPLLDAGVLK